LIAGIISSLISAIFGILLSGSAEYGENLILHQWLGISTAFSGILVWFLHQRILIKNQTQYIKTYRLALFITALGVIIAGHLGASLTHGDDYLSSTLPWTDNFENTETTSFDINSNNHDQDTLTKAQEKELNLKVRAIFAHNCYKCHGDEKVKGDLRLDSKDFVFKGGENGEVIVPGKPEESELFRRISLPSNHEDVMPSKGKKLTANDLAIIEFWIKKGAPWPDGSDKDGVFKVAELAPRNPVLPSASGIYTNPVDRWTNQYFVENKITWPKLVDDRTFLRRLYMDVIGLLPNKQEIDEFKKDKRPDKRAIWSKKLLDREDDYALHWLTFWNDALRNDYTGTGYITKGRYAITDWLYQSIKSNKPYDLFVKELVNPDENSKGFIEGIKWRGVVNSSQRTEMQAAQNVAQVFLGLNLKCASCHNSFISDWKLEDAYAFANIFADTTLEINRCDKPTGKFTDARMLWKELGSIDNNASVPVKRSQLANNMVKPQNGRLYRTLVNRIWAQIMGRGFIEPVDLMDNDPWSEDMLDWMAFNFQQNNSNIKDLIYLITSSKTYQLPSAGFKDPNEIVSQEYKFSGRLRKRMSAEQFADAGSALFGPIFPDSMVRYKPVIKNLKDQNIQLFARASQVVNNPFLTALGRPNRETVSTSRESQANLLQALELTNGERFNSTLKKGAEIWTTKYKSGDQIIKEIYRQALGREVRSDEYKIAIKILGDKPQADTVQDLFWAIMLLPEFQIIY
jgi:mono/diheme cytochrome c family protein